MSMLAVEFRRGDFRYRRCYDSVLLPQGHDTGLTRMTVDDELVGMDAEADWRRIEHEEGERTMFLSRLPAEAPWQDAKNTSRACRKGGRHVNRENLGGGR